MTIRVWNRLGVRLSNGLSGGLRGGMGVRIEWQSWIWGWLSAFLKLVPGRFLRVLFGANSFQLGVALGEP